MPKRKNTPEWTKTSVVWETKVLVWDRVTKGDSDTQIGDWLDRQKAPKNNDTLHLDRDTISSVRKELEKLPEGLAKGLPENIHGYWHSLQKQDEKWSPVINTQLLPNNAAEKSNTDPTTQDNTISESPQVKDEHFEQDKKPSAEMNTQPGPTVTEENKHESLPKDAAPEPNTQANDSEPSATAGKEQIPFSPEEESSVCSASPDDVDVVVLRSWGVSMNEAPKILFEWRSWHRQGRHDICQLFPKLKDYLKEKRIPFKVTNVLRRAEIWGTEFYNKKALNLVHLAIQYRYWENKANYRAFLKELGELSKPDPAISAAKRIHLDKIRQLLEALTTQVETALSKSAYYYDFDIERTSFLDQIGSSHSWEVSFDLWAYIHLRMDYDRKERELATLLSDRAPAGSTNEFGISAARLSTLEALHKTQPEYRKIKVSDSGWRLEVGVEDQWEIIGRGDQSALDECRITHVQLINRHGASAEIKELLLFRKKMISALKEVRRTVKEALARQTYLQGFCTECPRTMDND